MSIMSLHNYKLSLYLFQQLNSIAGIPSNFRADFIFDEYFDTEKSLSYTTYINENHIKEVFVSFNSVEYDRRKIITHRIIHDPAGLYPHCILIIYLRSASDLTVRFTSSARLRTRSALSRRNRVSKLPPSYSFKVSEKNNIRFEFLILDYPSLNPYKKNFFPKKMVLCVKNDPQKKFQKTHIRFEFSGLDYPSVNPYKKKFCNKSDLLRKRIDPNKILKT